MNIPLVPHKIVKFQVWYVWFKSKFCLSFQQISVKKVFFRQTEFREHCFVSKFALKQMPISICLEWLWPRIESIFSIRHCYVRDVSIERSSFPRLAKTLDWTFSRFIRVKWISLVVLIWERSLKWCPEHRVLKSK